MDRQELISKIISLYPDTFREDRIDHIQSWVEMYEKAIDKNWDMDKLMHFFATEYKSTVVPPHPSFFFGFRESVRPKTIPDCLKPKAPLTPEEEEERRRGYEKFMEMGRKLAKQMDINKHI